MKPIPVGKIGTRFILLRTLRAQQRAYVIGHTPAACQGRARYENVVRILEGHLRNLILFLLVCFVVL